VRRRQVVVESSGRWRAGRHAEERWKRDKGIFPRELLIPQRKWAERYFNLKRWTPMTAEGHFAPSEEPEQLVNDIRMFYRSLR
jgi:hypothetical protein